MVYILLTKSPKRQFFDLSANLFLLRIISSSNFSSPFSEIQFEDLLCFAANLRRDHNKSYLITQKGLRECLLILLTSFHVFVSNLNPHYLFDKSTKREKITISGDFMRFSLSSANKVRRLEGEDTDSI